MLGTGPNLVPNSGTLVLQGTRARNYAQVSCSVRRVTRRTHILLVGCGLNLDLGAASLVCLVHI